MTTAFKFVVAVARIRKPIKNLMADGQTCFPLLWTDSETIDRFNKREAIVLVVALNEIVQFPIVIIL
jgi:hypothetical protein